MCPFCASCLNSAAEACCKFEERAIATVSDTTAPPSGAAHWIQKSPTSTSPTIHLTLRFIGLNTLLNILHPNLWRDRPDSTPTTTSTTGGRLLQDTLEPLYASEAKLKYTIGNSPHQEKSTRCFAPAFDGLYRPNHQNHPI